MINVVVGDLASFEAEAVIRPIRTDLAPVNAQSRDLVLSAGVEVEERLQRIGLLPLGGAVMTPGGLLPADFVIHAVVMSPEEAQTRMIVQRALRNALRRAADWGIESLGVPPLGIGVGTIEADDAARTIMEILFNHLDEGLPPLAITMVVGSTYEEQMFGQLADELSADRSRA